MRLKISGHAKWQCRFEIRSCVMCVTDATLCAMAQTYHNCLMWQWIMVEGLRDTGLNNHKNRVGGGQLRLVCLSTPRLMCGPRLRFRSS